MPAFEVLLRSGVGLLLDQNTFLEAVSPVRRFVLLSVWDYIGHAWTGYLGVGLSPNELGSGLLRR